MTELTLEAAQKMLADTLSFCRAKNFGPMSVVVIDAAGAIRAAASEDGTPLLRWRVAYGKAYGAVAFGAGSRRIHGMAADRPHFVSALVGLTQSQMTPVPGGVLIRDAQNRIVGAIGVSGDTSDNDEAAAVEAIGKAGFVADGG